MLIFTTDLENGNHRKEGNRLMDKAKPYEATKTSLLAACKEYVGQRVDNAQQAIASASDAASDDTKSSAGDKFETTREMN